MVSNRCFAFGIFGTILSNCFAFGIFGGFISGSFDSMLSNCFFGFGIFGTINFGTLGLLSGDIGDAGGANDGPWNICPGGG